MEFIVIGLWLGILTAIVWSMHKRIKELESK